MSTADYLMQNTNNLTLVIITEDSQMQQNPLKMKDFRLGASRHLVEKNKNICCLAIKYLCNVPMMILQLSFTVLLMARINSLKASDPNTARIMQGNISFLLSFMLLAFNAIILLTDCFLDGNKIDTLIKWLMQIVVFGGMAISAWYALVCY